MSIHKKIHCCCISGEPFPQKIQECIELWHKYMPEYEFKLWDMNSFDIDSVPYVKQAVEKRKWAFASDYIRLFALYTEGGIYLDSDIMVMKSFDNLLDEKSFTAFESGGRIAAWIFASEPFNPLFREFLNYYDGRKFINDDGSLDFTPNTIPTTYTLVKHGLKAENRVQRLDYITVFSEDYFCPKNPWTERMIITQNTYAQHLFLGGWMENKDDEAFMKKVEGYTKAIAEEILQSDIGNKVYIYGAGIVGHIVYEYLKCQYPEVKIDSFIVSSKEYEWDKIEDIPLKTIKDKDIDCSTVVIISTIPKFYSEIRNVLDSYGFKNIKQLS